MRIAQFESDPFSGWYDDQTQVLYVAYKGVLTPDVTAQVYKWLGEVIQQHPQEATRARGSIYDFRGVTGFDSRNLTSAQRQSQQFNAKIDLGSHPVALLVDTLMQEQILRVELKISPGQERKRVVRSEQEALDFIASFHPADETLQ